MTAPSPLAGLRALPEPPARRGDGHLGEWARRPLPLLEEGARADAEAGRLLFGTVDTFLIWRLTEGRVHATDATNAARTMLFDIAKQEWDADICARLGIPLSMLPEVRDCAGAFGETTLLGGDWYPSLHAGEMGVWLPDPADDQHLAGGLLWSSGDLVGLVLFGVIFVQWVRSSMREGEREDRRLDLLEARSQSRASEQAEPR